MQESATLVVPAVGPAATPDEGAGSAAVPTPGEKGLPLRLGVLTEQITPAMVDEVVAQCGRRERRRRLLPARAVVYFVLALCLFSGAESAGPPGYRSVLRSLTHGLRHICEVRLPTSAALSRARQRLGVEPMQALFGCVRGPLAGPDTSGAFAFGLRIVAWDGTGIDTADCEANAEAFGRDGAAGHPQLRLLALVECGTHALLDAVFDGCARASEQVLARRVLDRLHPGMLLLADRNFPGHELWGVARATGADLAWRIKKNQVFVPLRRLPDGSFLSVMSASADNLRYTRALARARAAGQPLPGPPPGHPVRIIEYTVTAQTAEGSRQIQPFRLVTSLLDAVAAPAAELAALYHQRWESEVSYGELKTRLRGTDVVLRSRTPQMVCQEMFAFLVVYQSLCALRSRAATAAGIDPDRISFTITVRLARDQATSQAAATAARLRRACEQTITALLQDRLPARRARRYERIRWPATSPYNSRRHDQARGASKVSYALTITGDNPYLGAQLK